jgi:hypothetical protein
MVGISLKEKEEGRPSMNAPTRPHHPGISPDIVILVLFVVAIVAGVVSAVFNSSNGLALTQLALTLGGLLLGIVQVKPEILGKWLGNMLKYITNVLRAIMVVLLVVIIVLQTVILIGNHTLGGGKTPLSIAASTPTLAPTPTPALTPTPSPPSVLITAPTDGSQVSMLTTVQGTAQNIPKDEELWLFIVPSNQASYFPQPGPIKISGGEWSIGAHFGGVSDVGLRFTLIPVLINQSDQEAHNAIKNFFQQPGPVYQGIQQTSGMQLMFPEITVVRV